MQALLLKEGYVLDVCEVGTRAPLIDEVTVRVEAVGICGSDVHGVASRSPRRMPPLIMGHELVGEVVAAGGAAGKPLIGRHVAVNPQVPCGLCPDCRSGRENVCGQRELIGGTRAGGLAELVCVPVRCLHPVSGDLAPEVAVFAEPLATCVHALSLVPERFPETVVVLGAGTIGVLAAQALRLAGVGRIIVSESDEERRASARPVADDVVAPDELLGNVFEQSRLGVTLSVDAVGSAQTRRQSLEVLQSGGVSIWLGMNEQEGAIPAFDVVVREQRVQGAFAYTDREFERAVRLLEGGLITPAVPLGFFTLEESSEVFNGLLEGKANGFLKAVISSQSSPTRN